MLFELKYTYKYIHQPTNNQNKLTFKTPTTHISEPETHEYTLSKGTHDRYIVLGSDGIFEFFSDDEIIDITDKCDTPKDAAKKLIQESRRKWIEEEEDVIDDCTAVVIHLSWK